MIKFPPDMQKRIDKGCCGAWVGNGWMPIVIELDRKLAEIEPDYIIEQIKEKFGGLRYYVKNIPFKKAESFIHAAYAKAEITCEVCGRPGKLRSTRWIKTLCEKHNETD